LEEIEAMARHRRFSLEFKRQVVLDFLEQRLGLRELARKHNLSRNLLSQWVRKYETGQITDEIADAHSIAEYEGKIAELERKVGQLTMEVDLLKKGARLARPPSGDNCSIISGPKVSPSREDAES
jgi:transposase-like protein